MGYASTIPSGDRDLDARQTGASKSKLQRLVPRQKNGTPHDPQTGEITDSESVVSQAPATVELASAVGPTIEATNRRQAVGAAETTSESCGGELTGPDTKPVALATSPAAGLAPGPQDPTDDIGIIPDFLDRSRQVPA